MGPVDWRPAFEEGAIGCLIAGGDEKRPSHPGWFRVARDICTEFEVPFNFKQHGNWMPAPEILDAGGDSFHRFDDGTWMQRVGKKAAGRLLDGVEHNGMPG